MTQQILVGREIVGMAEPVGSDDELGLGDADDVLELFGPVEVDDGHHHGPGVSGAPEGDAASSQFGSWNTTMSPGPTPWSPSQPANLLAA